MTENQPTIIILHGDDEVARQSFIKKQIESLGDPAMVEMSLSYLDGKTAAESDLRGAAMAAPFFTSQRLVVLTNPLAKLDGKRAGDDDNSSAPAGKQKEARASFVKFLDEVPESTILILVIDDQQKWRAGNMDWEVLNEKHFLVKWAKSNPDKARMVGYGLPSEREMPAWIQKKAKELGGKFSMEAAMELAGYVGSDTRLGTLEIDKLITYAGNRQIEADDVMTISTSVISASIWDFTNAIGEKDARKAVKIFHQLMETMDVRQEIFPMIIWQFRQLLLGREVLDEGGNLGELMRELHLAEFQAKKLLAQVQRFKLIQLRWAYGQLMAIEDEGKSGGSDLGVMIDQFIIQLCGK
jgi:DNA polymerase III subunit delta